MKNFLKLKSVNLNSYINRPKDPVEKKKLRKRRIIAIGTLLGFIGLLVLIVWLIGAPMVDLASDPSSFRDYIEGFGPAGVLVFIGMTALQVIAAVIPGGIFELAAGYSFGIFRGAIYCDLGMALGSTCVFLLVRRFGPGFVELFFAPEKIAEFNKRRNGERDTIFFFLLFLIPGMPKDILSYVAGLTKISLPMWLFICLGGRFPSILLTAMSGSALQEQRYVFFIVTMSIILAVSLAGYLIYRKRMVKRPSEGV